MFKQATPSGGVAGLADARRAERRRPSIRHDKRSLLLLPCALAATLAACDADQPVIQAALGGDEGDLTPLLPVSWAANEAAPSVSDSGVVRAEAEGQTSVLASIDGLSVGINATVVGPPDTTIVVDDALWFTGFEGGREVPDLGTGHWDQLRTSGLMAVSDIVLSGDSAGTVNYSPQRESTFLWAADSVGNHNPVFVQWSLYVPPDYIHEPLNGRNDAANWKWLLIGTCNGYDPTCDAIDSRSSWTVWMESDPCDGDCITQTHLKYGVAGSLIFEQAVTGYRIGEATQPLVATADLGTWVRYTFEVRHATNNQTEDGELRMWKNGECIYELTGFPLGGDPSVGTAHAAGAMLYGWDNSASHNDMRYDDIGVYAVQPANLQPCS